MGGSPVPRAEIGRGYIASPRDEKEGAAVVRAPMSHDSACKAALRAAMMINWYYRLAGMTALRRGMSCASGKSGARDGQAADSGVREARSSAGWAVDAAARFLSAFSM